MDTTIAQLQKIWFGFDLGNYRPCGGTYQNYEWDSLPPLQRSFDGTFSWLAQPLNQHQANQIQALEQQHQCRFPADFARFVAADNAQEQIVFSPTACYFNTELDVRKFGKGFLVQFYTDQQDCVIWYLYFESTPLECTASVVLGSFAGIDYLTEELAWEDAQRYVAFCESSAESFLYRIHLENMLWYVASEGGKLAPEWKEAGEAYLHHYASNQ